jgi:hypothetical protein
MSKRIDPIPAISNEQVGKTCDLFAARLRKGSRHLPRYAVQHVLENEGNQLAEEVFQTVLRRVNRRCEMIVRKVTVNRCQPPSQLILALGHPDHPYRQNPAKVNTQLLETMPGQSVGIEEVTLYFFKPGGKGESSYLLETALKDAGLVPDYYAQVQANLDDPQFSKDHPNYTYWGRQNDWVTHLHFFHQAKNFSDRFNPDKWVPAMSCEKRMFKGSFDWIAGRPRQ